MLIEIRRSLAGKIIGTLNLEVFEILVIVLMFRKQMVTWEQIVQIYRLNRKYACALSASRLQKKQHVVYIQLRRNDYKLWSLVMINEEW